MDSQTYHKLRAEQYRLMSEAYQLQMRAEAISSQLSGLSPDEVSQSLAATELHVSETYRSLAVDYAKMAKSEEEEASTSSETIPDACALPSHDQINQRQVLEMEGCRMTHTQPSTLKKGDRVTMTDQALIWRMHGSRDRRTGFVVADAEGDTVRILRDGLNSVERWHVEYWKREEAKP